MEAALVRAWVPINYYLPAISFEAFAAMSARSRLILRLALDEWIELLNKRNGEAPRKEE